MNRFTEEQKDDMKSSLAVAFLLRNRDLYKDNK